MSKLAKRLGLSALAWGIALIGAEEVARAQAPPAYRAEFLGPVLGVRRLSASGLVIGSTIVDGNVRGFVASSGAGVSLLPLPPGMRSSVANDVNAAGVVVGVVGAEYSPEFGSRAIVWRPDGAGGYSVQELGALPGQSISVATALNDVGDIVGSSSDGTYRYPVLFTSEGGVIDLRATGVFDPQAVNNRRVVVDRSFTVKRLHLDDFTVEDLGVPVGLPSRYVATTAAAINESNQVAGLAILATSTSCDRQAARFTDGIGWEILSGCGTANSAVDINERGDVVMRLNLSLGVRLEGVGSFVIEDLIVNDVGHWYVLYSQGVAINDSRQIALTANNTTTGEVGVLLLTPIEPSGLALSAPTPGVAGEPNVLDATGAAPGAVVLFVAGLAPGATSVPGCADLVLGIAAPRFLGARAADAGGTASLSLFVPRRASGVSVRFQAVDRNACLASGVVVHAFP